MVQTHTHKTQKGRPNFVKGKGYRKRKSGDFQKAVKRALEVYNLSAPEAVTTFHQPHNLTVIRAVVQKLETAVFNWGSVLPFPPFLFSGSSL